MNQMLEKVRLFVRNTPRKNLLAFLGLVAVTLALPLSVFLSQQQQNLTQHAAGGCTPGDENNVNGQIYGCHLVNGVGVWDNLNTTAGFTPKPVVCQYGVIPTGTKKPDGSNDYTCAPAPTAASAQNNGNTTSGNNAGNTTTQTGNSTSQTGNTTTTQAKNPPATAVPGIASGQKCKVGSAPTAQSVPNGQFSYCDSTGTLHVGYCTNGNIPSLGASTNGNGVACHPPTTTQTTTTTTTSSTPTNVTGTQVAPTPPANATSLNGKSCGSNTSPTIQQVEGGTFTYCQNGTLHVGTCPGTNIPQLGGTGSGVVCKTPAYVSSQAPKAPLLTHVDQVDTGGSDTNPTPTPTPDPSKIKCWDVPGQRCGGPICGTPGVGTCDGAPEGVAGSTCCDVSNTCGDPIPPDIYDKTQQVSGTTNYSSSSTDPHPFVDAASQAGFTSEQIAAAGGYGGSPFFAAVAKANNEEPVRQALADGNYSVLNADPNGPFAHYGGCSTYSNAYPDHNNAFICYQNGQVKYAQPVDGCFDSIGLTAQVLGEECANNGYSVGSPASRGADAQSLLSCNANGQIQYLQSQGKPVPQYLNDWLNGTSSVDLNVGLGTGSNGTADVSSSDTTSSSTTDQTRNFTVGVVDSSGNSVATQTVPLKLNKTTGTYQGTAKVPTGSLANRIRVSSPGYFPQDLPATPVANSSVNASTTLSAGDVSGNGGLNVLDYNTFVSCSIFSKDGGKNCVGPDGKSLKTAADLNGDGVVNQDDYTILLKSFKNTFGTSSSR